MVSQKKIRTNLPYEEKEKIYEAIGNNMSSHELKEEFNLTPSKLSYYRKHFKKRNSIKPETDSRLEMEAVKNPKELTESLLLSFSKIKRENVRATTEDKEIAIPNTVSNSFETDSIAGDFSLKKDQNSQNADPFKIFVIDNIEVFVPANAKRIRIEKDRVIIER